MPTSDVIKMLIVISIFVNTFKVFLKMKSMNILFSNQYSLCEMFFLQFEIIICKSVICTHTNFMNRNNRRAMAKIFGFGSFILRM